MACLKNCKNTTEAAVGKMGGKVRRDKADGAGPRGGSTLYPKGLGNPLTYFKRSSDC